MTQPHEESHRKAIAKELKLQFSILGSLLILFWGLEIADQVVFQHLWRGGLDIFGIVPRTSTGLRGILFSPFLHGGYRHLIANTFPFLILGWFVMLQDTKDFFKVSVITMFVSGIGVWLIGQTNSVHIGASSLIFGYIGFLLFRGFFQRNIPAIALSLAVFFLYGGALWGILPSTPGISWEGHFFGFLGGILSANLLSKKVPNEHS